MHNRFGISIFNAEELKVTGYENYTPADISNNKYHTERKLREIPEDNCTLEKALESSRLALQRIK